MRSNAMEYMSPMIFEYNTYWECTVGLIEPPHPHPTYTSMYPRNDNGMHTSMGAGVFYMHHCVPSTDYSCNLHSFTPFLPAQIRLTHS